MLCNRGRRRTRTGQNDAATEEPQEPKYPKPKILMIDMPLAWASVLRKAGYKVSLGTFGTPYRVEPSDGFSLVPFESYSLPNCEEQEIVIADSARPKPVDELPHQAPGEGVDALWQSNETGVIDPRPYVMGRASGSFDRIQQHGGLFVVFISRRYTVRYVVGSASRYRGLTQKKNHDLSNWSFLSRLDSFESRERMGEEISFHREAGELALLLERGANNARYTTTLEVAAYLQEGWSPLARNKYGEVVAGFLLGEGKKGDVLILPQMPEAHEILLELVEAWLAQWNPALFPHLEGARWVHRPEYEIPQVVQLHEEIEDTRKEAEDRVEELKQQAKSIRQGNQDWYTLLRGTGEELVGAAIRSFERLGFKDVVDVDAQAREEGEEHTLREDVQIHDRSPVLIIEVKGIRGCPDDDEARQAQKHAIMRMREWDRIDVQPLTIINHQRHLPPHDRDQQAYRDEIVRNAEDTGLGLMTTWDLWRILRNKDTLGWPDEAVEAVFYRTGRIEPIPDHYLLIGKIVHVWAKAFGIVPSRAIRTGVTLAVETGDTFEELKAESLQVEGEPVQEAPAHSDCGVGCTSASERLREGMRVFLVGEAGQPE